MKKEGKFKDEYGTKVAEWLSNNERWSSSRVDDGSGVARTVYSAAPDSFIRGHSRAPTGICCALDTLYTSSKDGRIIACT